MTKGKTHCRAARRDILRTNKQSARRNARKAQSYDRKVYDGHSDSADEED